MLLGNGISQQMLDMLLKIEGRSAKQGQLLVDLDTFVKRVDKNLGIVFEKLDQKANGKDVRRDVLNLHLRVNGIQKGYRDRSNCPVMKIHVASHHNPDAQLGEKVRKTGSFLSKLLFWRR